MAITYGKSNFPPGGIDTSDATVVASDMKVGVTAYGAAGTKITGTMTVHASDQTASSITNSTTTLKFLAPAGYYDGSKYVTFTDADFSAGNIRVGYNIFGIDGTFTNDATATAGQILATVTAYVNGAKITGTMTNQGAYNITPGTSNQSIPAGYHNGSGVVYGDSDLVAGNIRSGVNIFGITGTYASGGNFTQPTLFAGDLDATMGNFPNVNYSGAGIVYLGSGGMYIGLCFFSTSLVTNSSSVVTSIDGVSISSGYLYCCGYSKTSSALYTYIEGNQSTLLVNKNINGQGCLYCDNMSSLIFFGTNFQTNSSGRLSSLDGITQGGSKIAVYGYSKL